MGLTPEEEKNMNWLISTTMKRFFIILIAACVSFASQAQRYSEIGAGISNVKGNYPETGARLSASVGLGFDYFLKDNLSVDGGLKCALYGKSQYGALFLSIPLTLNYHIGKAEFGAGPYVSSRLFDVNHNQEKYYDCPPPGVDYAPYATSYSGYFKRFDFGACLKFKYNFEVSHIGIETYIGAIDCGKKYAGEPPINGHTAICAITYGRKF